MHTRWQVAGRGPLPGTFACAREAVAKCIGPSSDAPVARAGASRLVCRGRYNRLYDWLDLRKRAHTEVAAAV